MKDSLKRLSIKYGGITAIIYAIGFAPIPFTTGGVTGARWIYNYPQDMKAETRRVDLAAIDRDLNMLEESRQQAALFNLQMQYNFLLGEKNSIQRGDYYTKDQKDIELDKLNRKIDELYDRTIRQGIKVDDIQSRNNRMMVASKA